MGDIAQSLLRRTLPHQSSPHGIALEDFSAVPAGREIGDVIMRGLRSDDPLDRRISLFFCEGFLKHARLGELGENLSGNLPGEVVRLANDRDDLTRSAAHALLVGLRAAIVDYRAIMTKALLDSDAQVRTVALNAVDTFLGPAEVEPLLAFKHDPYLSETGGMEGPVHYVLRDQALAAIERRARREFAKHELTEIKDGGVVFWWDWKPMLEWYRSSETGVWAKLRNKLKG